MSHMWIPNEQQPRPAEQAQKRELIDDRGKPSGVECQVLDASSECPIMSDGASIASVEVSGRWNEQSRGHAQSDVRVEHTQ